MTPLPIDADIPVILSKLRASRSLVLVAPPGTGKTTRVPPEVLRAGLLGREHPNLVMLQPRRVAARASAQRIAEENSWTLGREVGFHVRFEKQIGPATHLRVLTEGILTRQLLDDPFLEGVGCVILDEFHERGIHTDLCAAMLREVRQTVREDLILIVMSATLDAEPVSAFLGGCPIVRTQGRAFPVDIHHAGWSQQTPSDRAADAVLDVLTPSASATATGVLAGAADDPGDILVFLPGVEEIRRTLARLERVAVEKDLLLLPLHGSLSPQEQMLALCPARRRKVICATNIAETSLTIDGVRTVIDSGLARVAGYDPRRGLDKLELQRISKASADQRAGRAGRTAPGRCIRLWSESESHSMADFQTPEICRVDLAATVLMLHAWGKSDPRDFGWYEAPPEPMLAAAERLLAMLAALTSESAGQITPLGRRIMSLPVHPRLARLLLEAADRGVSKDGAAIAALLSEKDIVWEDRRQPPWLREVTTIGSSDLLMRLDLLHEAEKAHFAAHVRDRGIDPVAARQVARTRDELLRISQRIAGRQSSPAQPQSKTRHVPAGELVLLAYPDRVCRRRTSDPSLGVMVGGGGVRLAPESCVRQEEFFLALDARHDPRSAAREAVVRIASAIEMHWLEEFFPSSIWRERAVIFDPVRQRVAGVDRTWYRDLLLRETSDAPVDADAAAAALVEAVRPRLGEFFGADDEASSLMARLALLRQHMPEHSWPTFCEADLAEVLREAATGKRGLDELRRAPLARLLMNRLTYPLDRLLEQHAPEKITVPTGNQVRLDYSSGAAPVLAVRLQEVFGWIDTPRIAAGRVPVLMHLLGPNFRPVQITDDLRSFWSKTYFQVRKDLRVRYPKHAWPDDPLTAQPQARGTRRK